jgi:hypothetical protein
MRPAAGLVLWARALVENAHNEHRPLLLLPPQSLLCDPNPNSPANSEAARLYNENRCGLARHRLAHHSHIGVLARSWSQRLCSAAPPAACALQPMCLLLAELPPAFPPPGPAQA